MREIHKERDGAADLDARLRSVALRIGEHWMTIAGCEAVAIANRHLGPVRVESSRVMVQGVWRR